MKNLARVMGEPGQMDAIFLARNLFGRFPLLNIEDLDDLVVASSNQVIALIVEVQRGYAGGLRLRCFKNL